MNNVEEFFSTQKLDEPAQVTGKKRKRQTIQPELDELKKKARLYCTCPEQWRVVSRYNPKRLGEFCEEQEFLKNRQLYYSIFGFAHRLIGLTMDAITSADGHVQSEIEADMSLRQALEFEGSQFVQYLSNKLKIFALISVETFNGKQKALLQRGAEVVEINEDTDREDPESVGADDNVDHPRTDTTASTEEASQEGEKQV